MSFFCEWKKGWAHFGFNSYHQLFFQVPDFIRSHKFKFKFKFPLRFKRNLIHMFLIHLHSTHKNCSSIWSHCGPGALKSFQMSLPSWIEIQMLCFVSSKQIWNSKKSLGHKWEGTDGSGAWGEKGEREKKNTDNRNLLKI